MKTEKYKSLLVIVTGFLVLYFIFRHKAAGVYFLYTALVVGLLSLIIPVAGDYIVKGWNKIAEGLGWFNSRVLLSAIFFIFLLPFALLSKLTGKRFLQLRKTSSEESMYATRNHTYEAADLENIW